MMYVIIGYLIGINFLCIIYLFWRKKVDDKFVKDILMLVKSDTLQEYIEATQEESHEEEKEEDDLVDLDQVDIEDVEKAMRKK